MKRRYQQLYLGLAILMFATVVWGFWRSYYSALLNSPAQRPWILHLHAAVFSAWMLLFLLQTSLVALRRTGLHRRLGKALAVYAAVVLVVGIGASIGMPAYRVTAGQMLLQRASLVVLYNLVDVLTFGVFLAAAIYQRRSPEWHKRLLISGVIALTGAAVGRVLPSGTFLYFLVWLLPLVVLITIDLLQSRRIHPVSLISIAVFALVANKVALLSAQPWSAPIGHALMRPFL
jgi:hypothetical protein